MNQLLRLCQLICPVLTFIASYSGIAQEYIATVSGDTIHCVAIDERYIAEDSLIFSMPDGKRYKITSIHDSVTAFKTNNLKFVNFGEAGFFYLKIDGDMQLYSQKHHIYFDRDDDGYYTIRRVLTYLPGDSHSYLTQVLDESMIMVPGSDTVLNLYRKEWQRQFKLWYNLKELPFPEKADFDAGGLEELVKLYNAESTPQSDFIVNWIGDTLYQDYVTYRLTQGYLNAISYGTLLQSTDIKRRKRCLQVRAYKAHNQFFKQLDPRVLNQANFYPRHIWAKHVGQLSLYYSGKITTSKFNNTNAFETRIEYDQYLEFPDGTLMFIDDRAFAQRVVPYLNARVDFPFEYDEEREFTAYDIEEAIALFNHHVKKNAPTP